MPFLILMMLAGIALSKPVFDTFGEVKRFPFITYREAWTGTPAQSTRVAVPNVVIAYGVKENKSVVASASEIAYYLGQWTEDMGITPRMVRKGYLPNLVKPLPKALKTNKPIILLGVHNKIVRTLGLKFNKPTLKVVEWEGRKVLIVGGRDTAQVLRASRFLAHKVIGFKTGAYKTFFSFVKLRGMIEKGEFTSALFLIEDPSGLSACGKNMSLAKPMMLKFPKEVKKVVKKRNRIMYVDLVKALREGDKDRAVKLWKSAMFTCYQCHQGIGIKRLRKFVPNEEIHSYHQYIAGKFGLIGNSKGEKSCSACHTGRTEIRDY